MSVRLGHRGISRLSGRRRPQEGGQATVNNNAQPEQEPACWRLKTVTVISACQLQDSSWASI